MKMESLDSAACFMDDLLDFSSDIGEEEEEDGTMKTTNKRKRPRNALSSLNHHSSASFPPFPEFAEEELEWLSNKDAFPSVDTLGDILSNPAPKRQSPVSVLENSNSSSSSTSTSTNSSTITITNNHGSNINSIKNWGGGLRSQVVPVAARRARSKRGRTRRRDLHSEDSWWVVVKSVKQLSKVIIGRKCQHCGAEKTPQWRAGPLGPKTLCNACGVRFKSGRLVPEYRPASSPTFSSELHSNSHRKVMEMRRQKQMMGTEMEMAIVKPVDKG